MNLKSAILALALGSSLGASAAIPFGEVFSDSTIRFDYILGGTSSAPSVALSRTFKTPGWAGRRHSLDRLPLEGNAQLTLTLPASGDTVYRTSLSTLYHEWLALGDSVERAFQNTVLVPMPRVPVNVELKVLDSRHKPISVHRHTLDPADILIAEPPSDDFPVHCIHSGRSEGNKIQVAILPEGFTVAEMDTFMHYARETVDAVLAHEPFASLADNFDFIAVQVPSKDSGVSIPLRNEWRNTPFSSHFSTFYSDRYLTSPNVFDIHNALARVPYEHIIILANTDTYGGGGIYNSYTLTTTGNPLFRPVVVHEFGHSFGGLADEYFYDKDVMLDTYPTDVEPWEQNITTLVDFDSKWKRLIPEGTPCPTPVADAGKYPIGLYEGGGYSAKGIYRPADVCRMRVNNVDAFCPACIDALRRLILFYTE